MCPKYYLWKCDGQCDLCEYHAPDTVSLDEPLPDGNGTLGDYIPDSKPSIEDIYADRDLLKHLIARFRELDPDADRIIQMRLDNPKISDRKIAEALGRPQRTFASSHLFRPLPSFGWWSEIFYKILRSNRQFISSGR